MEMYDKIHGFQICRNNKIYIIDNIYGVKFNKLNEIELNKIINIINKLNDNEYHIYVLYKEWKKISKTEIFNLKKNE